MFGLTGIVNLVGRCLEGSPRQLHGSTLVTDITKILVDNRLHPSSLHLELTEQALMGDEAGLLTVLTKLHCLGVRIALDNFGTGYWNLPDLRRLGSVALVDDSVRQAELMRRCRRVPAPQSGFAGFRFPREVIVLAVRWYRVVGVAYPPGDHRVDGASRWLVVDDHRPGGGRPARYTKPGLAAVTKATELLDPPRRQG